MENKDIKYTLRLTKTEREILELEALKRDMRLSDYIRSMLFVKNEEKK